MADQVVDVAVDFGPDRVAIDRALESFCDRYLGGLQPRVADARRRLAKLTPVEKPRP